MARNPLIDKIVKASTTKRATTINKSKFLNEKDCIRTAIPALNIAYSGDIDGGLTPGFTMIAGPSKHFKSLLMLISMKAYLDAYPDAVALFYDSEFGSSLAYFESLGMNPEDERIIHSPVTDIEELRHDIASTLKTLERGDKVFIGIDSIGNLASRKEVEDAESGKNVADMTRAKQMKSLFRIITPHLTIKDIPLVAVNHTYKTLEMYSTNVVSGGTGAYYSADNIWIIGRQQEQNSKKELTGYDFIINIEKSRHVREKSKIPISVDFKKGLSKLTGILDIAIEGKYIGKVSKGKNGTAYFETDPLTGEIKSEEMSINKITVVLERLITDETFKTYVKSRYQLGSHDLISDDVIVETEGIAEEDDD